MPRRASPERLAGSSGCERTGFGSCRWRRTAAFHGPIDPTLAAAERERRGLPQRYFLYTGRHDARQDVATLFEALRLTSAEPPPRSRGVPWPPRILVVGATPDDRSALARAAERQGVGEQIAYAPRLDDATLAALVAEARAVLLPALSDATGLGALDSLAAGTPVVAAATGALADVVGGAGFLVEPHDPARLAAALRAAWSDDAVHRRLVATARLLAAGNRRTWGDVARETRLVYAEVVAGQTQASRLTRGAPEPPKVWRLARSAPRPGMGVGLAVVAAGRVDQRLPPLLTTGGGSFPSLIR